LAVLLLLAATGSKVGLEIVAVFVTLGAAAAPTLVRSVMFGRLLPLVIGPGCVQVTAWPTAEQVQFVPAAET
jgi:hypothetical protein